MSLTLKKFNGETMNKEVNNYMPLFTELKDTNQNCFKIPKRILVEDNVGIGETSFGRNVERDYAQETFEMFRLVLIAPLKLMTPNDCVEHVILRDNMALQKLKINSRKLRRIFETRGNECLIILNGNGEHAGWGKDTFSYDIKKIVEGEHLSNCTVVLVSRVEFVEHVKDYFEVIIRYKGFPKNFALTLAKHIGLEKDKIERVLKMRATKNSFVNDQNPGNCHEEVQSEPLYMNSRLFLFVCFILKCRPNDIKLDEEYTAGEICYFALRILYFNEMEFQCKEANNETFVTSVRNVGDIALGFLKNGPQSGKQKHFVKFYGPEVFNCGIVNDGRNKDFPPRVKEVIDPSFPDIVIQEFLAAFRYKKNIEKSQNSGLCADLKEILPNTEKLFSDFNLIDKSPTFHMFVENA